MGHKGKPPKRWVIQIKLSTGMRYLTNASKAGTRWTKEVSAALHFVTKDNALVFMRRSQDVLGDGWKPARVTLRTQQEVQDE